MSSMTDLENKFGAISIYDNQRSSRSQQRQPPLRAVHPKDGLVQYTPAKKPPQNPSNQNKFPQDSVPADAGQAVYIIPCHGCNALYVGQTGGLVEERIKQHRSRSNSATRYHSEQCGHVIAFERKVIVAYGIDGKDRREYLEQKYNPFVVKTLFANGTIIYEGIVFEMMNIIADHLNFTFKIIEPPDLSYGAMAPNGTFNGMKADIVAAGLTITYNRSLACSFSPPFHFESWGILVTATQGSSSFVQLFVVFSRQAWLAILVTTFLIIVTIGYSKKILSSHDDNFATMMFNSFWIAFSLLVSQVTRIKEKTWSGRIQQLFWRFFAILLFASYISSMISFLTLTRTNLPFKNMDELLDAVENRGFKVCLAKDTAFWSAVMADPKYASIKKFLLNNVQYNDRFAACLDLNKDDPNVAFIGEVTFLETVQTNYCTKSYVMLKDNFYPGYFGLAFRRNFSLINQVSDEVNELMEKGFVQMWKAKYKNKTECKRGIVDNGISMGSDRLGLSDLMCSLILLFIGYGISIFVFWVEKWLDLKHPSTKVINLKN